MIRYLLACAVLTSALAVPALATEKAKPKLTQEAKDGIQTTQDNTTKMKLKKAQHPPVPPPGCAETAGFVPSPPLPTTSTSH